MLTRRWFKVGDKLAREKVGQALRDAIKTRRTASSSSASSPVSTKKTADPTRTARNTALALETLSMSSHQYQQQQDNQELQQRPNMPNIIQGMMTFQPLEPRLEGTSSSSVGGGVGFGGTTGATSDALWSLLKEDANEKFKHPATAASFWDDVTSREVSSSSAQQPTNAASVGGNGNNSGVDLEPTPFHQNHQESIARSEMGFFPHQALPGVTTAHDNSGIDQQQQHPNDVYSNSEASRKRVLGMFQSMLPEMAGSSTTTTSTNNSNIIINNNISTNSTGSSNNTLGLQQQLQQGKMVGFSSQDEYQKLLQEEKRLDQILRAQKHQLAQHLQLQQHQQHVTATQAFLSPPYPFGGASGGTDSGATGGSGDGTTATTAASGAGGGQRRASSDWFLQPAANDEVFDMSKLPW